MTSTDPSGLQIITTYFFKVNTVEYDILTGDPAPTFQEVADLMDAALTSANFSTVITGDAPNQDLRVINEGDRGWDSEIDLEFGESGPNLWINLIGFIGFDPAVPGRGAFSIELNASVGVGGKIQTGGAATYFHIDEPPVGSIFMTGAVTVDSLDLTGPEGSGGLLTDGIGYYQIGYVYFPGGIQEDVEVGTFGDVVYQDSWYMSSNPDSGIRIKMGGSAEYELEIIATVESGSATLSGTLVGIVEKIYIPTGSITLNGSVAIDEFTIIYAPSGVATFAGIGVTTHTNKYTWDTSGGAIFDGVAELSIEYVYSGLFFGDVYYKFNERTSDIVNDAFSQDWWVQISNTPFGTNWCRGVEYGGPLWMAVSQNGKVATSTDGITWVLQTTGESSSFEGAGYNGSNLWAVCASNGVLITSSNGVTWNSETITATELYNVTHNQLSGGSGLWITTGVDSSYDGLLVTSPDGSTWTPRSTSFGGSRIYDTAYDSANSLWVAVGEHGKVATSSDGTTWGALETTPISTSLISVEHNQLSGGSGLWVAVGASGEALTSPNGTSWTQRTSQFGTTAIQDVTYDSANSEWIIVGFLGKLSTSPDGITWTLEDSSMGTSAIYTVDSGPSRSVLGGLGGKMAKVDVANKITLSASDLWTDDAAFISAAAFEKGDWSTLEKDINPQAVSFWHKRKTTDQDSYRVFGASADDEHWYFAYEPPYFRAMIRNGASYYYFLDGADYLLIPDDDQYHWYYVEFYSGSNANVYVDNVYRGTTSVFFGTSTYELHTIGNGGDAAGPGIYGFGLIDDLRVYSSYRLDADQRNIIYTQSPDPGSIILGGSSQVQIVISTGGEYVYAPTGGIILTGERYNYIVKSTAIIAGGTSPVELEFAYAASGGMILQSVSTYYDFGLGYVYGTSGAAVAAGSSIVTHTRDYLYTSSGGMTLSSGNLTAIIIETSYYILLQEIGKVKMGGSAVTLLNDIIASVSGGAILNGAIDDSAVGVVAVDPSGKADLHGSAVYSWAPESGYQELGLTSIEGTDETGLSDSTDYYFRYNIDDAGFAESSVNPDVGFTTWTDILSKLNSATSGGTWALYQEDVRLTSDSTGPNAKVRLSSGLGGTNLFTSLTGFTSFDDPKDPYPA